ncbi:MAG TPA: KH domain-containing protein [Candidatus Saccharimonadales bacterium]|nr:KH domain-containing protein [Candidatus Saccharimonadales bacterium]
MSTIDQQFVEFVVKSLVGKPDEVKIERRVDEKGVLLELTVDPEDLGRVIGKRGATAQSLRTLLRALGTKNEARYNLKIVDNGVPKPHTSSDSDDVTVDIDQPDKPAKSKAKKSDDDRPEKSQLHPYNDELEDHEEVAALDKLDAAAAEAPAEEPAPKEEAASDRLAQTRAELADLDDLDI